MRLRVELAAYGVVAGVAMYADAAPTVTRLIYDALMVPLDTYTAHACFDGHEVYCFLPAFPTRPPLENRTMRPQPGEIMFWHAQPNEFACTRLDRLSGGSPAVYELAFIYGEADLRHYWEDGFHGSLVGCVDEGFQEFARSCADTLVHGRTPIRILQDSK